MSPAITIMITGCEKRLQRETEEAIERVLCAIGYLSTYDVRFNVSLPISQADKTDFLQRGLPALFVDRIGDEGETAIISILDSVCFLCFSISPRNTRIRPGILVNDMCDLLRGPTKVFNSKAEAFQKKETPFHDDDLCKFVYPELGIANEPTAPSRKKPLRQPKANLLEPRTKAGHDAEATKEPCFVSSWDTVTELPTPEQDVDYFFEPTLHQTTWDTVTEEEVREPEQDMLFALPEPRPTPTDTLPPVTPTETRRTICNVRWFRRRKTP